MLRVSWLPQEGEGGAVSWPGLGGRQTELLPLGHLLLLFLLCVFQRFFFLSENTVSVFVILTPSEEPCHKVKGRTGLKADMIW